MSSFVNKVVAHTGDKIANQMQQNYKKNTAGQQDEVGGGRGHGCGRRHLSGAQALARSSAPPPLPWRRARA